MPQLTPHVHVVGRGPWGGLVPLSAGISANVFCLDGGSELALIDPGMPEGLDDVLRNIQAAGLDPARLTKVFLTHAHWDHCAALPDLLHRFPRAIVFGHALARETLAGEPGIYLPEYRPAQPIQAPVHELLADGDTARVGDLTLRVLATPGHTPDGLVFTFDTPAGTHAFTGDTAIGDQPDATGVIGWIDHVWRSHLSDFRRSLARLRDQNFAALYPGHGNAHLTPAAVRTSLDHCLWRLDQLINIPGLGSMLPVQI